MTLTREQILGRQLERARREIATLERLLESKTRSMFGTHEQLSRNARYLHSIIAAMHSAVLVIDPDGAVRTCNDAACRLTGCERHQLEGRELRSLLPDVHGDAVDELRKDIETSVQGLAGDDVPVLCSFAELEVEGEVEGIVCVLHDLRERRKLELELRHAQKLESIGQMAAGIAHEVNTPIQYAGDCVGFLQDALAEVERLIDGYGAVRRELASDPETVDVAANLAAIEQDVDLAFLRAEMPGAAERALDGIRRVGTIVKAMKAFAHPGGAEMAPSDLNAAIRSTLEVCRHEYHHVATIELDLQELPLVCCNLGDVNQVVLNLIVNACHAIEDRYHGERIGQIRIGTAVVGGDAVIEIRDDGNGIPSDVQARVFDPFFTTKEVGRGTGQGLAIARNLIVDRHRGRLLFSTEPGAGTTFRIHLPLAAGRRATTEDQPEALQR